MTFRIPAAAVVAALLGFAFENRASAQPLVPGRSGVQSSPFQSLFYPGTPVVPNVTGAYGIQRLGAGGMPMGFGGGVGGLGGVGGASPYGAYGPWTPFILNRQAVVFNNRGHWYANYYSHWYPNGLRNGAGVLTNGGAGFRLGGLGFAGGMGGGGMGGGGFPGGMGGGGMGGGGMGGGGMGGGGFGGMGMPGALPVIR